MDRKKLQKTIQAFMLPYESLIGGWTIDEKLCDQLIELHKNSPNKVDGRQDEEGELVVNPIVKDSTDIGIWPKDFHKHECTNDYAEVLLNCLERYCQKYPFANHVSPFGIIDTLNIQHYKPGGGFKAWHFENGNSSTIKRHLVYMTFLNDVKNGGTEFFYQNLKVPAVKGLTVIWPAGWTHTHKGQISKINEKYIATGWFEFK